MSTFHNHQFRTLAAIGFLAFLALRAPPADATTVIGVASPTEITVGSDSLMVSPQNGEFVDAGKICKIHQADHLFFASAGFLRDESGSLDVEKIVRQTRVAGEPIRDTVDRFVPRFQSVMTAMLTRLLAAQGDSLRSLMVNPGFDVDIVFFGMEKGSSVACIRRFQPKVGDDGTVTVAVVDSLDYDGRLNRSRFYFALGYHQEIDSYLAQHAGSDIFAANIGSKLDDLLRLEAEKHPHYVGPPISIVDVDSNGARWLSSDPLAPPIQPYRD